MSDQIDLQPIQQSLNNCNDVLIAIAKNPNYDMIAASLGLFLSLKDSGKNVFIVCPSPMVVEFSRLVGLDKIKNTAGNKNLVVSFDYIQDSIEKVNYNVEGNKFNLVIQPKTNGKPLDPKNVAFSYSGIQSDMIFIVGATSFADLEDIFSKNEAVFSTTYTISINRELNNHFAQTTITDPNASSISEITSWFLDQTGYQPSGDAASNLLAGIDKVTNLFSSPKTPATAFVTAGKLMQSGAVRQTSIAPRPKVPNIPSTQPVASMQKPLVRPMLEDESKKLSPSDDQLQTLENNSKTPPKDWLEPKIYSGTSKV